MFASPQPNRRMLMTMPKASLQPRRRMLIPTPVTSPHQKHRCVNPTASPDLTPMMPFSPVVEEKELLPEYTEVYPSRSVTPCDTANSSPYTSAKSTPEKKKN